MRVTILGCGGSGGVPYADGTPGGNWGACDPANPRNRRRRVSILVEHGGTTVLVDTSPDLRAQLLDARVEKLDGIVFTHAHADHCHGLDELRGLVYRRRAPIDTYMDRATHGELTARFAYAFASSRNPDNQYRALMDDHMIDGPFRIGAIDAVPFAQGHGSATTLGIRFGPVAYSTDVEHLDDAAFVALDGIALWIVDCLREAPHPTHAHLARTLEWITRVRPARAILTHMNHQSDYDVLRGLCPPGVEPGYDGMTLDIAP